MRSTRRWPLSIFEMSDCVIPRIFAKEIKRMADRLDSLARDEGNQLADEMLRRFKAVLQELHIEFEARKHPVS